MRFFAALLLLFPALAAAQVPGRLGYQGQLLKSDGTPESGVVQVTFSIFDAPSGGSALWSEQQSLALTDGFYATVLGEQSALTPSVFNGQDRYLEMTLGGAGLAPRHKIAAVPYAISATDARNVVGGSVVASSLTVNNRQVVDSSGRVSYADLKACANAGEILKWNGTEWTCAADAGGMTSVKVSAPLSGEGTEASPIALAAATSTKDGYLTAADRAAFAAKLDKAVVSAPLTGDGTAGAPIALAAASASAPGYLAPSDYAAFTGKLSSVAVASPLTGTGASADPITLAPASGTAPGYLSAADYARFDGKVSSVSAGANIAITGAAATPTIALAQNPTLKGTITFDGPTQAKGDIDFNSQATKGLRVEMASSAPVTCDAAHAGYIYFSKDNGRMMFCDGKMFLTLAILAQPTSCAAIKAAVSGANDGMYNIDTDGSGPLPAVDVYCDMTTDGGGWTLVSYGYRASTGTTNPYFLPNAAQGTWDPAGRNGIAAIDATALLKNSTAAALTTTDTVLVKGNLLSYAKAFVWNVPSPGTATFTLNDPSTTSCATVAVRELKANRSFNAYTLSAKPMQVSCSGNKAGTAYERQFLGFNKDYCWGVCGSDPVNSMGMVVWYGSGYYPTTSDGSGASPERPASFGFWLK